MLKELPWDSAIFGKKIGKFIKVPSRKDRLEFALTEAVAGGFDYITCRLRSDEYARIRIVELCNFYLTDIGVTLEMGGDSIFRIARSRCSGPDHAVRPAVSADIPQLRKISRYLFPDSRFYHDHFFTRKKANTLYGKWVENAVLGTAADIVYYAPEKGFIACRKTELGLGEISLIGVRREFRSKKVGSAIMRAAMKWFVANDVNTITVRTQLRNRDALNFYIRAGFSIKDSDLVYARILQ